MFRNLRVNVLVIALYGVLLHAAGLWAIQSGLLRRAFVVSVPVQMVSEIVEPPEPVEPFLMPFNRSSCLALPGYELGHVVARGHHVPAPESVGCQPARAAPEVARTRLHGLHAPHLGTPAPSTQGRSMQIEASAWRSRDAGARFFKRPFSSPRHPEYGKTGAKYSARCA